MTAGSAMMFCRRVVSGTSAIASARARSSSSSVMPYIRRAGVGSLRDTTRACASSSGAGSVRGNASCEEAYEMLVLEGTHVYIDCRSESEYRDGHPIESANFPYPNSDNGPVAPSTFLESVSSRIPDKSTPILVGCRSGVRSLAAIEVLNQAGYNNLTNVEGGFVMWSALGFASERGDE